MNRFFSIASCTSILCLVASLRASPEPPDVVTSRFIAPQATDPAINRFNLDSHYVALSSTRPRRGELLVFLCGSYSRPRSYRHFLNLAATEGFHVVGLMYPDDHSILVCDTVRNVACYDNMRREIVYGTPVSDQVSVDSANCILNRLVKLLQYLDINDKANEWNQFIGDRGLRFERMVVAGHSQGAGHAAFIAHEKPVIRVLMFSGPDDYSECHYRPAPWTESLHHSRATIWGGLLHKRDEIKPYVQQCAVWSALALPRIVVPPTIDNRQPPFESRFLCTNALPSDGRSFHNSTIVDAYTPKIDGEPALVPVWRFLLLDDKFPVEGVPRRERILPPSVSTSIQSLLPRWNWRR